MSTMLCSPGFLLPFWSPLRSHFHYFLFCLEISVFPYGATLDLPNFSLYTVSLHLLTHSALLEPPPLQCLIRPPSTSLPLPCKAEVGALTNVPIAPKRHPENPSHCLLMNPVPPPAWSSLRTAGCVLHSQQLPYIQLVISPHLLD